MNDTRKCSECGARMPSDPGIENLCPKCLLVLGLGGDENDRQQIGNYEILSEIGRGGMGVVYKAYQVSLNRIVALKVLSEGVAADKAFIQRFYREAKSAAALNHPGVVTIYDVGHDEDTHFIAMEYVKGRPLAEVIEEEGQMDVRVALRMALQTLEALRAAHELQLVHRDIKPQNILVDDTGRVKVADFGLAKKREDTENLTDTGSMLGTPAYMAPEQCRGEELDGRADLFSTGVVLYQMLAGQVPFPGKGVAEVVQKITNAPVAPIREFNQDVPPVVTEVLSRALAKHPTDRYANAENMARDIQRVLEHLDTGGSPALESGFFTAGASESAPPQAPAMDQQAAAEALPRHRRWLYAAATCLLAVALAVSLAYNFDIFPLQGKPSFADYRLDAAVREAIGKPSGDLTARDLADPALRSLALTGAGISDLTGIEWCIHLSNLDLSKNEIVDLTPLAVLKELTHLDVSRNKIADLAPLRSLPNITELRINSNQISDLRPLEGFHELQKIPFSGNPVRDLSPLRELPLLETLDLTGAPYVDLETLQGFTHLTRLIMNGRGLEDLTFLAGLHNLVELALISDTHECQIQDISALAELKNLERLHLEHSQIKDISPLRGLTRLQELYLRDNDIQDISALATLPALETIDLIENQVTDLQPLLDNPDIGTRTSIGLRGNPARVWNFTLVTSEDGEVLETWYADEVPPDVLERIAAEHNLEVGKLSLKQVPNEDLAELERRGVRVF